MLENKNRSLWIDYLRSFITILVVAHHSAMAYAVFAQFDDQAYNRSTHPIVDASRWIGFDVFIFFNDIFFMSLMFFIGGIFLIKSINKKGRLFFIKDRFYRLFVPFILLGTFLMLLAYWPSFYIIHHSYNLKEYVVDFFTIEKWPVGPPWFIWVLFVFNVLFAIFAPNFNKLSRNTDSIFTSIKNRPFVAVVVFFTLTWSLYVPLTLLLGQGTWTGFGPFDFQLNRVLLYFGYFSVGIIVGNSNFNEELFSTESKCIKYWPFWAIFSVSMFALLLGTYIYKNSAHKVEDGIGQFGISVFYYSVFAFSCALSSTTFVSIFKRFIHKDHRLWNSLSENAYMIYLFHYVFITWTQFLLLKYNIPVLLKFSITLILSLFLSWGLGIALRQIPVFKKYV